MFPSHDHAELQLKARKQQVDEALQNLQREAAKDQAELQLKARKQQVDEALQAQKLDLDQQKLATQILDKAEGKNIEKEKLATKIIQEGLN